MIIDDEWYTIGSCNVNDRGFETEGELNISVYHKSAKDLRKKIFSNLLCEECPENMDKAINLWYEHSVANHNAFATNSEPRSFIFPFIQAGPPSGPFFPNTWL